MALELRNVTRRVGHDTHIHDVSLALEPGGFNILLGATNAGKSTLIKLMAVLEKPTTGSVWMDGDDVTGVSPQRRNIALVHQFFVNYPHLSVYDNIASPLRVLGRPADEIDRRVRAAADVLQLGPMLKRRPHELSGGQQQRTALARAIVKDDIPSITAQLRAWIDDPAIDVVISTGGTGVTGRDVTPEAFHAVYDKEIPGFGELFRMISYEKVGTSTIQSRATAGVAGATYIFCLPGSPGACRDGWDGILAHQLDYRSKPCNFVEIMPRLDEHLRRAKAKGATV